MSKIEFIENKREGYASRTKENIKNSDATLAIAIDFHSPGEMLTKRTCYELGKLYIPMYFTPGYLLKQTIDTMLQTQMNTRMIEKLNIAGNGIYSLNSTQETVDMWVYNLLSAIVDRGSNRLELIESGGQTGIDEAGLKAASRLGIPALCIAPRFWVFRDEMHRDIKDEILFKQRFEKYL